MGECCFALLHFWALTPRHVKAQQKRKVLEDKGFAY